MLRKKRRARVSAGVSDDVYTDEADEIPATTAEFVREDDDSDSDVREERRYWRRKDGESIGSYSERGNREEKSGRKQWSEEEVVVLDSEDQGWHRRDEEARWQRRSSNTIWESDEEQGQRQQAAVHWQGSSGSDGGGNIHIQVVEQDDEEEDEVDEDEQQQPQPLPPRSVHGSTSRLYHLLERGEQHSLEREERRMLIPADVTDEEFPTIQRTPQQRHLRPRALSHEKEEFFLNNHHKEDEERVIERPEWRTPKREEEEVEMT